MNGISIIICTFNGEEKLGDTINHIVNLKSKYIWELIIVDNASTDNTSAFCREMLNHANISWQLVYEPSPGLSNARMRGLKESRFEHVLFCDDDNQLFQDYIFKGYEILRMNPSIGALGGCGIPLFEHEKPEWFDRYSHSFAVGPQAAKDGRLAEHPAEIYGAGTFFCKKPLLDFFAKGFITVMSDRKEKQLVSGGDVEWCYILQLAGYEIWYNSSLQFHHWMPAERMQWEYYLRLKKGIARGTARLFSYSLFWDSKIPTSKVFYTKYILHLLQHFYKYAVFLLICIIKPRHYNNEIRSLGAMILLGKAKSFFLDFRHALNHFHQLKKFKEIAVEHNRDIKFVKISIDQ